ncbi:TPA: toprim domain-containing protein [Candidatus Woesearchaeota archaeon]|nr:toprim domain-containing protein [Candidatus Woesearchaeota archaeon]
MHLTKLQQSNTLVIVEGKNDKHALQKLGLNNILTLSTPLFKILDIINGKKVAILTDFDKEGQHYYKKLKSLCSQHGIKIDNTLREYLQKKTSLVHIEGLATFVRNQQRTLQSSQHNVNQRFSSLQQI